ncbi:hypothetical protein IWX63_001207 [Arthrobacter sp. CAN_A2]|uniref:hypothetical protein n=1 Tax=Arthrobacter sp. CAN_A2 TaxID=2787718 RepID=UPI001A33961D
MTRAQIRNLEERSALWVAKHLVMAGRLLDLDPELAFQHALAASRRGGRLAAVREAVGLTAYGAGHYGEALREFRTFRRISGSNVHLPVMADCERGLGRPDRALDLARSEEAESLDAAGKAELAMVVSGARADLGQLDAAVAALEIPQLDLHRAFSFTPRLFRAYAAALDAVGRSGESEKWRRQARVAEKALGLDDELEPDIIDLGEDDEPAPMPVPKVAEILGTPARSTEGADVPGDEASAGTDEHAGEPSEADSLSDAADPVGGADPVDSADTTARAGAADDADSVEVGAVDAVAGAEAPAGNEQPSDGTSTEAVEQDTHATGHAIDGEHQGGNEPAAAPKEEGALTEEGVPAAAVEDHESADVRAGEDQSADGSAGPVRVDAIPAGESVASAQPLQTEMLFSMDDAGDADFARSAGEAGKGAEGAEGAEGARDQGTAAAPSLPIEFSEASAPTQSKDAVDD